MKDSTTIECSATRRARDPARLIRLPSMLRSESDDSSHVEAAAGLEPLARNRCPSVGRRSHERRDRRFIPIEKLASRRPDHAPTQNRGALQRAEDQALEDEADGPDDD